APGQLVDNGSGPGPGGGTHPARRLRGGAGYRRRRDRPAGAVRAGGRRARMPAPAGAGAAPEGSGGGAVTRRPVAVAGWSNAGRTRTRAGQAGRGGEVPGRDPDQRAELGTGAGRAALRRHPGPGRPDSRGAGRGLPGRRGRRRAQGDRALRGLAGRRSRPDGAAAGVDEVLDGVLDGLMPFDFATAGRILVGAGRAATELPGVVAGLGSRVLVCTGANPDRHAALLGTLELPTHVSTVDGEPTVDTAREVIAAAREH